MPNKKLDLIVERGRKVALSSLYINWCLVLWHQPCYDKNSSKPVPELQLCVCSGRGKRSPVRFTHLGEALRGADFLSPALCWGQRFWQHFVAVFPATYIPLVFIISAPNALGL